MSKEKYINRLNEVMSKYKLDGGFLHMTYSQGIQNENLTPCYIDSRVKNGSKVKKELAGLIDDYLTEFPTSKKPLYSYK